MDYLYDGTYKGLMTALYINYKYKKTTGIFTKNLYQKSMISDYKIVKSNEEFSKKMEEFISNVISKSALKLIYYAYLSKEANKEEFILKFINLGLKKGNITQLYSHEDTLPIQKIYDKVSKEKHRFLGILRFKDLKQEYTIKINGILQILMRSFTVNLVMLKKSMKQCGKNTLSL